MNKVLTRALKGAVFSLAFMGMATQAIAQVPPPQQTGIASPGRAKDQFLEEKFVPRVTPKVEVKKLRIEGAPAGAEDIKFELGGITMEGATAYPKQELRMLYGAQIGKTVTLADLYAVAADLTRKYRNDGYILTQVVVPPQTIEGGIARLKVIEGTVDNIEVRGPKDGTLDLIRKYASQIKINGPLNSKDLERALLLINDLAGVDARGVLNPSPDKSGTADLIIIVERKGYDAQIGVDNFGTRFLGPVQLSAAAVLNSFFDNNEKITAQAVMAPEMDGFKELLYGSLSYEQPIWSRGTTLGLSASHTITDPGFSLKQFGVKGRSTSLSAKIEHPFVRSRSLNISGRTIFDYREVTSKNNIPVDPTRKDHIRSLRVGGTVETLDNFMGVAYNVFDLELSKGLDVLGASGENRANVSRPAADTTFFKMNAEIQRLQRVLSDVNLLVGVTGQWSNNALLSSEEFGVGGMNYGRGFDSSEIIGDDGIAGKLEVQWSEPYALSLLDTYQLYGFYDAGRTWNDDATTRATQKETLVSTGLGIRADFSDVTTAGFMMAFPLRNTPQTQGDKDPRFFVNLNRQF